MPYIGDAIELDLGPDEVVPEQDDLFRVDPTTSFAPTLYSTRQLRCRLQVKGYTAVPVDETVVGTPGELGPKGYLDRRTAERTTGIAVPVGTVSLITVQIRRFLRGSVADIGYSNSYKRTNQVKERTQRSVFYGVSQANLESIYFGSNLD